MSEPDLISSFGVLLILIPFFLGTMGLMDTRSKLFFLLNLLGGVLACWGSIAIGSIPFAVLEGSWGLVALTGLWRAFRTDSSVKG